MVEQHVNDMNSDYENNENVIRDLFRQNDWEGGWLELRKQLE